MSPEETLPAWSGDTLVTHGTVAPKAIEPSLALAEQRALQPLFSQTLTLSSLQHGKEYLCSPWTGESCDWSTVAPTSVRWTEGLRAVAAIPSGQKTHLSTSQHWCGGFVALNCCGLLGAGRAGSCKEVEFPASPSALGL